MKATLYSKEGKKKKEVVLNPEIYGAKVNDRLLQLVGVAYRRNLRRGTAKTKERAEVRGGGKKPWRQKGTGRARASTNRSPLWVGGGTTFGPRPRDYSVNMPNSMRKKALVSALSLRASQKKLLLLESVQMGAPKTKELAAIVDALPNNSQRALCVVKEIDANLERASRNLKNRFELQSVKNFNAHHILSRERLVIEQGALPLIEERLRHKANKKAKLPAEESEKKD